jgi:hypothetical protein
MAKRLLACVVGIAVALGARAGAQQSFYFSRAPQGLTTGSNVSANQVKAWLQSGDSRTAQWGAYFASRVQGNSREDERIVTILLNQLGRQGMGNRDFIGEVLYALIERGERVPADTLNLVAADFPIQTLILSLRLPVENSWPLLEKFYEGREINDATRMMLARVAGLMMAGNPPQGFARELLSEMPEELTVSLVSSLPRGPVATPPDAAGSCSEGFKESAEVREQGSNTPPIFLYELLENWDEAGTQPVLVEAPGERIVFRALRFGARGSRCHVPRTYGPDTRRQLLAEMMGKKAEDVPWTSSREIQLLWRLGSRGAAEESVALQQEVDKEAHAEDAKLCGMVEALYERGALTSDEAESGKPELSISSIDYRHPGKAPAVVTFADPYPGCVLIAENAAR